VKSPEPSNSGCYTDSMLHRQFALTAVVVLVASLVSAQSFQTTVTPLPSESFAGPCSYDLTLPAGKEKIRAVWVTYDRGRDIMKFYSDPEVIAFARRHHLALMMPHQCPAKNAPGGPQEMDMDPSHGIGRALFSAADQFAHLSGHPELSSAKLILLGFSGTGALFAHFVGYAPDRVVAAILAAPGHYDPVGIDRVHLSPTAIQVPELIIVGGADKVSGTERPYNYFTRYREKGAPWTFLVQNSTPHCCVINTKAFLLDWLEKIVNLRQPSPTIALRKIDQRHSWLGYIKTCVTDVRDSWTATTWNVCDATIELERRTPPVEMIPAGWLPSHRLATEWLDFIKQPTHDTASLP
jgi:pimeloyl-ACP methyl ester carboxylesterase